LLAAHAAIAGQLRVRHLVHVHPLQARVYRGPRRGDILIAEKLAASFVLRGVWLPENASTMVLTAKTGQAHEERFDRGPFARHIVHVGPPPQYPARRRLMTWHSGSASP
jgi:hypothetical protein